MNKQINSKAVTLTVNGTSLQADPKSHSSLLTFLRNELKLTGSKSGCGAGNCGACSVLVDSIAVQSCQPGLSAIADSNIQTIESIIQTPLGKQITAALTRYDAAQCGYCLPGIVVAAFAEIQNAESPEPVRALQRNLCRCGTHTRILKALQEVIAAADVVE